ncbi:peptidylprolyl isomerase [Rhodopirellula sp. P2]|uniref:peptidylprolyl isomerase n=1 Tax=Rhodopirellula sp. P2 TaxID=2127060 RepID=UPI002368648F|nr:peptidylprolyl isomerase [Rhodopirellula sp. P2]WDQ15142.1 peptidylprolyl isomerase [Rhodopirellula sp. P2]
MLALSPFHFRRSRRLATAPILAGLFLTAGLVANVQVGWVGQASAQDAGANPEQHPHEHPDGNADAAEPGVDGGRVKDDPEAIAKTMAEMPDDVRKEAEEVYAKFRATHKELLASMLELRKIHIRYNNDIDRSRDASKAFRAQQHKTWDLMQEQMENSVKVFRLLPSPEAASYMVTMVQHHFDNDIYDLATFEAAARLIDIGQNYRYLFLAAARAGIANGNFETARKVYESLGQDELEQVDLANKHFLDELEKQYKEEQERMEKIDRDSLPQVRLTTTRGDVLIELYPEEAPSTVANFIQLVEDGFYDGLDFTQVVSNMLALSGDSTGDGRGNSGKFLIDEHTNENAHHVLRGSVVMAKIPMGEGRFIENSASSQFAIFFLPVAVASSHQTVFGRVIEGMDRVSAMRRRDPSKSDEKKIQLPPDAIISAEVVRKGPELPEPNYVDMQAELKKAEAAGLIKLKKPNE